MMLYKTILSAVAFAGVGLLAHAETDQILENQSEALAWTVAAYASCETEQSIQRDFRAEVARKNYGADVVFGALRILESANNVCGQLNSFSSSMLTLSSIDYETFQARLLVSADPQTPVFELEEPEGSGRESQNSILLEAASLPPPLSGNQPPATSSDYQ